MNFFKLGVFSALSLISVESFAFYDLIVSDLADRRCSRDSLSIEQARARNLWAKDVQKKSKYWDSGRTQTTEIDFAMYNWPAFAENYWNSVSNKPGVEHLKGRPLYPTFLKLVPGSVNIYDMNNSPWRAYPTSSYAQTAPAGYQIAAFCTSSCFAPGMKILTSSGYVDISFASDISDKIKNKEKSRNVVHNIISPVFSKNSISFREKETEYVTELSKEKQEIISLYLENVVLKVTENHVFVSEKGTVLYASEVVEMLKNNKKPYILNMHGKPVNVEKYELKTEEIFVYNVRNSGNEFYDHLYIVDGFLSGDSYLQSLEFDDANRHLFRLESYSDSKLDSMLKNI